MASAEIKGLHSAGVTGTIKHFCGNNQETNRIYVESVISERALREIYLKGFEIAVREGKADSVMTSYNPVNGIWTAGNHDLNTMILREDWGFKGIVMTDWWAFVNNGENEPLRTNLADMVCAQNDLYMVCADCSLNDDDIEQSLEDGKLTRGELQRSAKNILSFILQTNAMKRITGEETGVEVIGKEDEAYDNDDDAAWYDINGSLTIDLTGIKSRAGQNHSFSVKLAETGIYRISVTASSLSGELAQIPVTIFLTGTACGTMTWNGTAGEPVTNYIESPMFSRYTSVRLYFAQNGLDLHSVSFELIKASRDINFNFVREDDK